MIITVPFQSAQITIWIDKSFYDPEESGTAETHSHPGYEINFVAEGSGSLRIEGKQHQISAGDYYITGPAVRHQQIIGNNCGFKKISFRMEFDPVQTDRFITNSGFFLSRTGKVKKAIITQILQELKIMGPAYEVKLRSLFSLLLVEIIRDTAGNEEPEGSNYSEETHKKRSFIIEDYIEDNYNRGITARDMAEHLNVSVRQLNRIFQATYKMSFKQKLLERRIQISQNLLEHTDLPIQLVSRKIGYDTVNNFSALFKRKTGMTPLEYRKKSSL
jgi:AraC-like DNA-binding protein